MTAYTFEYQNPVDIGNRALQHLGLPRITTLQDNLKTAGEISFVYDKVRRAELRRNYWKFSTRFTVLRPIDTTSMIVVPGAFNASTNYGSGYVVSYDNVYWYTLPGGTGNTPGAANNGWEPYFGPRMSDAFDQTLGTSYFAQELVYDALNSNAVYVSLINANNNALNVATAWLPLTDATLISPGILYPLGAGPLSQQGLRNIYRLPNGFLRKANQMPKAGVNSWLGAPYGLFPDDWEMDDLYIITSEASPIVLRFIADETNVTRFDDMFCEGLACRIAYETCQPLTQSTEKQEGIAKAYAKFMTEARLANAIEGGAIQPAEDDYIVARF